jgi:hypothetical protein
MEYEKAVDHFTTPRSWIPLCPGLPGARHPLLALVRPPTQSNRKLNKRLLRNPLDEALNQPWVAHSRYTNTRGIGDFLAYSAWAATRTARVSRKDDRRTQ